MTAPRLPLLARLVVLALALTLPAVAAVADAPDAAPDSTFRGADRDKDGIVDRREFQQRTVDVFYFIDVDKDGYLTIIELRRVRPEQFEAADHNNDGKLSVEEFQDARAHDFDTADVDGNGVLSPSEISAAGE